jgi:hypothetical protein
MARPVHERTYMSLWHVGLMGIGIFEYKTHKSFLAKILAGGMILFHADAAISDALDTDKCLSRFLLEKATGINFEHSKEELNLGLPPKRR